MSSHEARRKMKHITAVRVCLSVGALVLLVVKIMMPNVLDTVVLGLAFLIVLPWLSSVIQSAKLPGGREIIFSEVKKEQVQQREDLDLVLSFLVENFVSPFELVHLQKLANATPFPFSKSEAFEAELRRLLALGLIHRKSGKGIRSLFTEADDVQNHLEITTRGREYMTHRRLLTARRGADGNAVPHPG